VPLLLLLHSNNELTTVVVSLEQESETKDIEDVKEFAERVFDKTPQQDANPLPSDQDVSFLFYNKTPLKIYLETISPPPDHIKVPSQIFEQRISLC
jgi:hypothetical protein